MLTEERIDSHLGDVLKPWHAMGTNAFNLHWLGFYQTVKMMATDVQKAKWLPLIRNSEIIGCYA